MNYLEFFKINAVESIQIEEDINLLENKCKIKLPPILKLFYKTFDWRFQNGSNCFAFQHKQFDDCLIPFYNLNFNFNSEADIGFINLHKFERIFETQITIFPEDEGIGLWDLELITIGECFDQAQLMVGFGIENVDKIYLVNYSDAKPVIYLCDNIFDFYRNYLIIVNEHALPNGVKLNQLYKNWGEDFWRIRDEQV